MLAAVAVICVVPASVGIVGGIGGILIGLICAVATVFLIVPVLDLAAWGCAIGFVVAAGYTAAAGTGAETLLFIGLALVSAALGILLWKLTVYLFRALFPALLNGIVGLFRRVFHRS